MERKDRLFVPLAKEPFVDFLSNGKLVEVRKNTRGFTEKFIYKGRRVELRLGYSGQSIWGEVEDVLTGSLEEIVEHFGLEITEPQCNTIEAAINSNKDILGEAPSYIGFKMKF